MRYACSYAETSLQGMVTANGKKYGGKGWNPNGLPGPTYTAMTKAFGGTPLIPTEHYLVIIDVASRRLTVVVYPQAALVTAKAIAAGRLVIAQDCAAITNGTPAPPHPEGVTTTAQ